MLLYCTDIYNLDKKNAMIQSEHMKKLFKENHKEDVFFDNNNNSLNISLSIIYKIFSVMLIIFGLLSLLILFLPISYFLRYLMCLFSDNGLYNLFITNGTKSNIFDINSDEIRMT